MSVNANHSIISDNSTLRQLQEKHDHKKKAADHIDKEALARYFHYIHTFNQSNQKTLHAPQQFRQQHQNDLQAPIAPSKIRLIDINNTITILASLVDQKTQCLKKREKGGVDFVLKELAQTPSQAIKIINHRLTTLSQQPSWTNQFLTDCIVDALPDTQGYHAFKETQKIEQIKTYLIAGLNAASQNTKDKTKILCANTLKNQIRLANTVENLTALTKTAARVMTHARYGLRFLGDGKHTNAWRASRHYFEKARTVCTIDNKTWGQVLTGYHRCPDHKKTHLFSTYKELSQTITQDRVDTAKQDPASFSPM